MDPSGLKIMAKPEKSSLNPVALQLGQVFLKVNKWQFGQAFSLTS